MRIWLSIDMEGVSGVTRWEDVITSGQDYQRARSWLTGDVNAAVAGAREGGATEIVAEENHGVEMLTNVLLDEVDPDVDVVRGIPRHGPTTVAALDDSFDGIFLVGHHAKVGDYPGICAHTISYGEYKDVRLGGRSVSEGEIFALIGAQHGVPTVLITGDDVVCAEMARVVPDIEQAVVKEAMSRTGGRIIPPKRAQQIIRTAACRAVERLRKGEIEAPPVDPPFEMEIELRKPVGHAGREVLERYPELTLIGDRTVAFSHAEMATCYRWAATAQYLAAGRDLRDV